MRGDLTLIILEIIQATGSTAIEIADALTYYGRAAHYKRLKHIYNKISKKHKPILEKQIALLRNRQRVSKLISNLKAEGLVAQSTNHKNLVTTKHGDARLMGLESKLKDRGNYKIIESNDLKIVTFDIPEREAAHRAWLRSALKILKFRMLQRSVWLGSSVLPEDFINDLHVRGIEKFVEIMAITKQGTLKRL